MPVVRFVAVALAKTLSKFFGLATMTFFGRLPSRDDDKIATIGVLSLTWPLMVVAAFWPEAAELIVPFLPDDETLLFVASVTLVVAIPLVNGWLSTRIENVSDGAGTLLARMLLFYPYTALIGLVVMAIVVVVPAVKFSYLARRVAMKNIAVMILRDDYDAAVDHIREALARHGIATERTPPHAAIGWLFAVLVRLLGDIYQRHMARKMTVLRGQLDGGGWFEVTLHATDISILGREHDTTVIYGLLAEELDQRYLYFSWDDSSQELEDRIREGQQRLADGDEVTPDEIADMAADLRGLSLETEEWNAIRRHLYGLECEYYKQRAGLSEHAS